MVLKATEDMIISEEQKSSVKVLKPIKTHIYKLPIWKFYFLIKCCGKPFLNIGVNSPCINGLT